MSAGTPVTWPVCIFVCIFAAVGCAPERDAAAFQTFHSALQNAQAGDVTGALRKLHALERNGVRDADVEFNLAVLYLRQGERGRAVLHLERCLLVDPGQKEARRLLRQTRTLLSNEQAEKHGESITEDRPPLTVAIAAPLTEHAWALLFLLLTLLASGLALVLMLTAGSNENLRLTLLTALSLAALLAMVTAAGLAFHEQWLREGSDAIVVEGETPLYTRPPTNIERPPAPIGMLPEGSRARVLQTTDDGRWAQVKTGPNLAWAHTAHVRPVQ